jgi:hypothetical protein
MPHPRILATSTVAVAIVILVSPAISSGQSTCDWKRVQALGLGQTITVEAPAGLKMSGRLVGRTPTDLTISTGDVEEKIARDRIVEVSARKTTTWKTGVGLVLGGLGLMVAGTAGRPAEAGPGPAWLAGVPITLIGSLIVHGEKPRQGLIYRRP